MVDRTDIDPNPQYSPGARRFTELLDTFGSFLNKNGYKLVINEDGTGITAIPDEGGSGGDVVLPIWTPDLFYPPIVPSSGGLIGSFDTNASVVETSPDLFTITQNDFATLNIMYFGNDSVFNRITTDKQGIYLSIKTPFNGDISESEDGLTIAIADNLPPTVFAVGINIVREGTDQWFIKDFGELFPAAGPFTDAEMIDNNLCVAFSSPNGSDIVIDVYLNGSASDSPVFTATYTGTGIDWNITDVKQFGIANYNTNGGTEPQTQPMVIEWNNSPSVAYNGVELFTDNPIIDPASYPDPEDGRANKPYIIAGLDQTVGSELGFVQDGIVFIFDEDENPGSRTVLDNVLDPDANNTFTGANLFTNLNRFDGGLIDRVPLDGSQLPTNDFGQLDPYRSYLHKITNSSTYTATLGDPSPDGPGELLKYIRVTAVGKDGKITISTDNPFWQDGEDTLNNSIDLTSGMDILFVGGPTTSNNPRWHIIQLAPGSGSDIDLNLPTTWTTSPVPITIGAQQVEASTLYSMLRSPMGSNGSFLSKAVFTGIPGQQIGADGVAIDPAELDNILYVTGIIDEPQLPGTPALVSCIQYNKDPSGLATLQAVLNGEVLLSGLEDGFGNLSAILTATGAASAIVRNGNSGMTVNSQSVNLESSFSSAKITVDESIGARLTKGNARVSVQNIGNVEIISDGLTPGSFVTVVSNGNLLLTSNTGDILMNCLAVGKFAKLNKQPDGADDLQIATTKYVQDNAGIPYSLATLYDNVAKSSNFLAEVGKLYDVSDFILASVIVSAPVSPNDGDEVGINSVSANVPPIISQFSGLTMEGGEECILRYFGEADEWKKVYSNKAINEFTDSSLSFYQAAAGIYLRAANGSNTQIIGGSGADLILQSFDGDIKLDPINDNAHAVLTKTPTRIDSITTVGDTGNIASPKLEQSGSSVALGGVRPSGFSIGNNRFIVQSSSSGYRTITFNEASENFTINNSGAAITNQGMIAIATNRIIIWNRFNGEVTAHDITAGGAIGAAIGAPLGIPGFASPYVLFSTDDNFFVSTYNTLGGLQMYQFNGAAIVPVGNLFPLVIGQTAGCALTKGANPTMAIRDSSTNEIQAYSHDGTDFTPIGNRYKLPDSPSLYSFFRIDDDSFMVRNNDRFFRMKFDGTDFKLVGGFENSDANRYQILSGEVSPNGLIVSNQAFDTGYWNPYILRVNEDLPNSQIIANYPTYADDVAAGAGGLKQNAIYKTATGELRIKL